MPAATARALLAVILLVGAPVAALPGTADAELTAEFTDNVVIVDDSAADATTTLVVDAPADEAVYIDSPAFEAEALAGIFGGEVDGDRVRVPLPADGRIEADFHCVKARDATFTVTGVDSGAMDEASIGLTETLEGDVAFTQTVVRTTPGETADVPIEFGHAPCIETITVRVGSAAADFLATVEIVFEDNGETTLAIDTDVPTNASAGDILSVQGADVRNMTLAVTPSEPLAVGEYNLSLMVEGEEQDLGTLIVSEQTPTPSPTPTATPTESPTATSTPGTAPTTESSPTETGPENGTDDTSTAVPGFGVGVAIVAVATGGWIAKRRPS